MNNYLYSNKMISTLPIIEDFASTSNNETIFNTVSTTMTGQIVLINNNVLDLSNKGVVIPPVNLTNPISCFYIDYPSNKNIVVSNYSIVYKDPIQRDIKFDNMNIEDYLKNNYSSDTLRIGKAIKDISNNDTYVYDCKTSTTNYLLFKDSNFLNLIIKTDTKLELVLYFVNTNVNNLSIVVNPRVIIDTELYKFISNDHDSLSIYNPNGKKIGMTKVHNTAAIININIHCMTTPIPDNFSIENNSIECNTKIKLKVKNIFNNYNFEDYLKDKYSTDMNRIGVVYNNISTDELYVFNYNTNTTKYILFNESTISEVVIQTNSIKDIDMFFFNTTMIKWSILFNPVFEDIFLLELRNSKVGINNMSYNLSQFLPHIVISKIQQKGFINQIYIKIPINKTLRSFKCSNNKVINDNMGLTPIKIKNEPIEEYLTRLYVNNSDIRYKALYIKNIKDVDTLTYTYSKTNTNFDTIFIVNCTLNNLVIRISKKYIQYGLGLFFYNSSVNNWSIDIYDLINTTGSIQSSIVLNPDISTNITQSLSNGTNSVSLETEIPIETTNNVSLETDIPIETTNSITLANNMVDVEKDNQCKVDIRRETKCNITDEICKPEEPLYTSTSNIYDFIINPINAESTMTQEAVVGDNQVNVVEKSIQDSPLQHNPTNSIRNNKMVYIFIISIIILIIIFSIDYYISYE